jgi:hypothetical protein
MLPWGIGSHSTEKEISVTRLVVLPVALSAASTNVVQAARSAVRLMRGIVFPSRIEFGSSTVPDGSQTANADFYVSLGMVRRRGHGIEGIGLLEQLPE